MTAARKREKTGREIYEIFQTLILASVVLVLLFSFVGRPVLVDGGSMRETLQDRDMLMTVNASLYGDYRAGDIVVLRKETFHNGSPIIKRIIATEGQKVDIDFHAGIVYVDDIALEENYIREPTWTAEGLVFPAVVPEGHVFVMGDNRNDSDDSRNPQLGMIDNRLVIGRAFFLLFPGETVDSGKRDWARIGLIE